VKLPAVVNLSNVRSLREAGVAELRSAATGSAWLVDAQELQQFDSSLLSLLLDWQRAGKPAGIAVRLAHASATVEARLRELSQAYGLDGMLGLSAQPGAAA
jgi:ABC-type transporter Mla MlaB component